MHFLTDIDLRMPLHNLHNQRCTALPSWPGKLFSLILKLHAAHGSSMLLPERRHLKQKCKRLLPRLGARSPTLTAACSPMQQAGVVAKDQP